MNKIEQNVNQAIQYLHSANNTDYIGESVSQLEHALQGAYFAEQSRHSEDVILATLFHDIGHFASPSQQLNMENLGIVNHEWIGAQLAHELGFSSKVALLIGYHVDAKRYLAAKKPNYYQLLSEASKGTLVFQGGPMSDEEIVIFEAHPYFKEILQVRVNDEKAKVVGLDVPDLDYYRPLIKKHFEANQRVAINHVMQDFVNEQWVSTLKNLLHN